MSQFGIHAWAAGPGEFFILMMAFIAILLWRCAKKDI